MLAMLAYPVTLGSVSILLVVSGNIILYTPPPSTSVSICPLNGFCVYAVKLITPLVPELMRKDIRAFS